MQKIFNAEFVLLDKRDYVHATSMIEQLFKASVFWRLGSIRSYELKIHRPLYSQGKYLLLNESGDESKHDVVASFNVTTDKEEYKIVLISTDQGELIRKEYDENGLVAKANYDPASRSIRLPVSGIKQFANIVISLNKALLSNACPGKNGKWYCRRIKLDWSVVEGRLGVAELVLQLSKMLGDHDSKSNVMLDEINVGWVYFSRRKP
ncbi:MAG: hypothetical protein CMF39_01655 [Legionellaceae bacterium]|nr:hypothetical protein [Legionellaceae bacterium]|tara:strand:- start:2036 stop:2656 length:621 start_codon:yes stop_codon:yes gene_type:complete